MPNDRNIELISRFESGYSRVEGLVAGIGSDELKFIPPVRAAWSINDFLVHLLDAEISLAFRVRAAIAEPGKAVPGWEEEDWHDALHYGEADGLACLDLAKGLRAFLSSSLRSVADADWSGFFILHPAKGRLGLGALVEMYERHLVFHFPLIKRNREAWLRKEG
jgi:hypothetical protein